MFPTEIDPRGPFQLPHRNSARLARFSRFAGAIVGEVDVLPGVYQLNSEDDAVSCA